MEWGQGSVSGVRPNLTRVWKVNDSAGLARCPEAPCEARKAPKDQKGLVTPSNIPSRPIIHK